MCGDCGCAEQDAQATNSHGVDERRRVAVIAVGGNSLILDSTRQSVEDQYEAACETARHIARLIELGWNVVVTHGNGPQVGFILRRSELARHELHEVPLDACGADTQGALGYALQRAIGNALRERGICRTVSTVVTQVVVDHRDPAFEKPTKPIGSFMKEDEAKVRQERDGWSLVEDSGRGWRRVVASPFPKDIVELHAIETLVHAGVVVIAVGGGGIPVIRDEQGNLSGVAAVIDKDFASALLARNLNADVLIISTAVEQVALDFGKPTERRLSSMTLTEAQAYLEEGHFAPGSMAPKIKAIIDFLESGGEKALITTPFAIPRALAGETGTWITKG